MEIESFYYFAIIGITLFIGFISTIIFERTKISQVILLMLFGFILGPALGIVDAGPNSTLDGISQFLATISLIILLFDGGMMLNIISVVKAIPRSTLFTFLLFGITVILITGFMCFVMQWQFIHGILLGAIVGGTSSAIVIALAEKSGISEDTKSLLTLESTITDALCIISAVVILEIISETTNEITIGSIGNMLLGAFLIALLIGIAAAVLWMFLTRKHAIEKYSYMLTLGMVFIVYAFTQELNANGAFAVFIFGLTLGNSKEIAHILKIDSNGLVSPMLRVFQEEVTFFVRTFFFVFIGLLMFPKDFGLYIMATAIGITILSLIARKVAQRAILNDMDQKNRDIVVTMMPRGLAAAILATLPLTYKIDIPDLKQIVLAVLLLTNIEATAGVFMFGGEKPLWPRWWPKIRKTMNNLAGGMMGVLTDKGETPESENKTETNDDNPEQTKNKINKKKTKKQ